jgi:hypothetical protein
MRVRLTRKLAGKIAGVEVQGFQVDDVLDLPPQQASLLVAEEWAIPEHAESDRSGQRSETYRAS